MTYEEMQSTMQFILEQQAQFTVNIQKLEEKFERLGDSVIKLESSVAGIGSKLGEQVEDYESLRRLMGAIAVAQANTEVNLARTEKNVARLEANQSRTDENLNTLILTVEKYLSDRHNGQA